MRGEGKEYKVVKDSNEPTLVTANRMLEKDIAAQMEAMVAFCNLL